VVPLYLDDKKMIDQKDGREGGGQGPGEKIRAGRFKAQGGNGVQKNSRSAGKMPRQRGRETTRSRAAGKGDRTTNRLRPPAEKSPRAKIVIKPSRLSKKKKRVCENACETGTESSPHD